MPHPGCGLSPTCFQQVAEGSLSPAGSELELDFASRPREQPPQMESWSSGEQRCEVWRAAWAGGTLRQGSGPWGMEMPVLSLRDPDSLLEPLVLAWAPSAPPALPMPS